MSTSIQGVIIPNELLREVSDLVKKLSSIGGMGLTQTNLYKTALYTVQ